VDDDPQGMSNRRIAELTAPFELAGEKSPHVVIRGERDCASIGLERLHEHAPRRIAAAPARKLSHELKRALLGAEVGQAEAGVRVDDRGKRAAGKVVTF